MADGLEVRIADKQLGEFFVANAAIKAIYRNRRLVVMEPFARFMYAMKRFAPWLMDAIFHFGRRKRMAKKMAQLKQAYARMGSREVKGKLVLVNP